MASSNIHLLGRPVDNETIGEYCRFKVLCSSITCGAKIYFPAFATGDHLWYIVCSASRDSENQDDYLSFSLFYVGEWKDVYINFNFGVHKKDEALSSVERKTRTFTFPKHGNKIQLDKLVGGDELKRYLKDDYFIVICNIRVLSAVCMTTFDSGIILSSSLTGISKIYPPTGISSTDDVISSENLIESESAMKKEVDCGLVKFRVKCSHVTSIDKKYQNFPMFMVGGHCWVIQSYYCSIGNYMSFDINVISVTKDLKVNLEFSLLKKNDCPSSVKPKSDTQIFAQCGKYKQLGRSIEGDELKQLLRDDYFEIICSLTILSETVTSDHDVIILDNTEEEEPQIDPPNGPSSCLCARLNKFIQNNDRADVTFEVSGEFFNAHRLVLAAQSPVFDAELFGSIDGNNKMNIKISEMKPKVFEAMLKFIYTDVLIDLNELSNGANKESNQKDFIEMFQHLLVASSRYALERLKLICEDKLSEIITFDTVVANLVLAEKHNCPNLKAKCLEYVILPQNFGRIAVSDEYTDMIMSYPTIRNELKAKF